MEKLSIVIPFLNEGDWPYKTIQSIYNSADSSQFEIIAVDDASDTKYNFIKFPEVKYIRNEKRIGCDASRQIGIEASETNNILILDAHMLFYPDSKWLNKIVSCIEREEKTIWCTTCVGFGYGYDSIYTNHGRYYGATLSFISDAEAGRPVRNIIEPKWQNRKFVGLEYEIPCILGANYAFRKEWFNHLHGLKGLKMWGTSEPFLSLKSWLAGGSCRITTEVEIGHRFRQNAPYKTQIWSMVYNKIYFCKTLLPETLSDRLIKELKKDKNLEEAISEINKDIEIIKSERKYYNSIFKVDINDFCNKFSIILPQ